uniref:Uncharacterized protein n=1 Tax=Branchiostoma floridae TaxID=7739 RepID=C3ZWG6_BRAFL|eukprot:XP_002587084.1 hypothetical protein BRAFLDRAFT_102600 [Branchiostoma floridae]
MLDVTSTWSRGGWCRCDFSSLPWAPDGEGITHQHLMPSEYRRFSKDSLTILDSLQQLIEDPTRADPAWPSRCSTLFFVAVLVLQIKALDCGTFMYHPLKPCLNHWITALPQTALNDGVRRCLDGTPSLRTAADKWKSGLFQPRFAPDKNSAQPILVQEVSSVHLATDPIPAPFLFPDGDISHP